MGERDQQGRRGPGTLAATLDNISTQQRIRRRALRLEFARRAICGLAPAFLVTVTLSACNAPASSDEPLATSLHWAERETPSSFRKLLEEQPGCEDCLRFRRVAEIGDEESGPGLLTYDEQGVVVDTQGNFWVGQVESVKVFDRHGTFLRSVGRQGQGPMEFQDARPIFVDKEGNVHLCDFVNARETVVGSDFSLIQTRPFLQKADTTQVSPLPGGRYVSPMWVATPDRIGFPLHVFDESEILQSFGIRAGGDNKLLTPDTVHRLVTTDSSGHILSIERYNYLIEAWTVEGVRVIGLEGPRLNDAEVSREPWSLVDNPPPQAFVYDIEMYDRDRLWVLSLHRRENWRDAAVEKILPSGNVMFSTVDGTARGLFSSRLDIVDLNAATIVASGTFDGLLSRLIGGQQVIESTLTEGGDFKLSVWHVDLMNE